MIKEATEFRQKTLDNDKLLNKIIFFGTEADKKTYNYLYEAYRSDPLNQDTRANIISYIRDIMKIEMNI